MTEETTLTQVTPGRPWDIDSTHDTFESADQAREDLKIIWKASGQNNMEVKVRRRNSDGKFVVKTRAPAVEKQEKKKKKRVKKGRGEGFING